MDKIVLVVVADENYLNHAKYLFQNIKTVGKWKGDLCLLTPSNISNDDKLLFNKHNISVVHVEDKSFYNKFYIFHEFFKKWDKVFYLDCDIFVFKDLNYIYDINIEEGKIYASIDNEFLYNHICQGWDSKSKEMVLNNLESRFDNLYKKAFNTGVLLFNTSLINKNTVSDLIRMKQEMELINNHTNQNGTDQPIINLYFDNKFEELDNKKFILSGSVDEEVIIAHFFRWFAPWINDTFTINGMKITDIYRNYLQSFNSI